MKSQEVKGEACFCCIFDLISELFFCVKSWTRQEASFISVHIKIDHYISSITEGKIQTFIWLKNNKINNWFSNIIGESVFGTHLVP